MDDTQVLLLILCNGLEQCSLAFPLQRLYFESLATLQGLCSGFAAPDRLGESTE